MKCVPTDSGLGQEGGKPVLKTYDDLYNHVDVRFDLQLDSDYYDDAKENPAEFEKRFRLTSTWRTTNMVGFNNDMKIDRYNCVGDILEEFFTQRLQEYEERRSKEIERLRKEAIESDAKARFLRQISRERLTSAGKPMKKS
jgi:DNA topoisomerase-2